MIPISINMCLQLLRNQGCSVKSSLDSCNLLIVDTKINSNDVSFIVDTGATSNFIDKTYVKYNLQTNKIKDDNNTVLIPNSEFVSTSTVDLEFDLNNNSYNSSFIVCDFSNQIEFLKSQYEYNKNVCGILGNSFLLENNAVINYKTKKIVL